VYAFYLMHEQEDAWARSIWLCGNFDDFSCCRALSLALRMCLHCWVEVKEMTHGLFCLLCINTSISTLCPQDCGASESTPATGEVGRAPKPNNNHTRIW